MPKYRNLARSFPKISLNSTTVLNTNFFRTSCNMETIEVTEMAALAAQFVNSTDKHVFLTGKAGTGKTTFLRHLASSTHKRHVILAPTGIAALNANGVTIHSQFLLPFGTFLPDRNLPMELPEGHCTRAVAQIITSVN